MFRVFYLAFILAFLSACSVKRYPDLNHYSLEDFLTEPAICHTRFQCRYVGYGLHDASCDLHPIFEGYVIYSTLLGSKNIQHLERLVMDTTPWLRTSVPNPQSSFQNVEYELEECLPVGNHIPKLRCINNRCVDSFWDDL